MKNDTKQIHSITPLFYCDVPAICGDEDDEQLPFGLEDFATMTVDAVYVLDFLHRKFAYVANRDLFLHGHSVDKAMTLGYDFFPKIIHPNDLPLFAEIHAVILRRLCGMSDAGGINYFSFSLRMGRQSQYLMGYHKLKPVFVEGQIRYGMGMVIPSLLASPGHLRTHNNGADYEEYSIEKRKWDERTGWSLSDREKEILRLTLRGKTGRQAADILCISYKTFQHEKEMLYKKLNIHSLMQAIDYTLEEQLLLSNNLIYHAPTPDRQQGCRRTRHLITPDMILRIQEGLNQGHSVNSIAKQEHIAESAIRYTIVKGRLEKRQKQIR